MAAGLREGAAIIDVARREGNDVLGRLSDIEHVAAEFFPKLVPFASALTTISSLLREGSEFEREVFREFKGIRQRLDAINRHLDTIEKLVFDYKNVQLVQWQMKRIRVHKLLWPRYMDFLANPNKSTLSEFLDSCDRYDMLNPLNRIHSAITGRDGLLATWKRDYDRGLLKRNFTTATGLFVHAVIMYESCIAVCK